MSQSELLFRILLTIVFGAIIGLETETREIEKKGEQKAAKDETQRIGGLRTYTVLSLIGGLAGIFYAEKLYELAYLIFGAICILIIAAYILNVQQKKAFGITTEIAILITFLLGFTTTAQIIDILVIIVILVLLTFFLSQKRGFGKLIHQIRHEELIDIIKFALISVVILPVLPNETYTIFDLVNFLELDQLEIPEKYLALNLLNPFRIWFIVVVISGIDLLGYILNKIIGSSKGIIATSVIGGLISSTSTTIALATKSKQSHVDDSHIYAGGAIIANSMSFITISLLILALSSELAEELLPAFGLMWILGIAIGVTLIVKNTTEQQQTSVLAITHKSTAFALGPAIKFVLLIVTITFIIQVLQLTESNSLVLVVTALSGITGMDSAVIAVGELVGNARLDISLATTLILATNCVNFGAKISYGYLYGDKKFVRYLFAGLFLTLLGSIGGVL